MDEFFTNLAFVFIGTIVGLFGDRVYFYVQERKQKREAFQSIGRLVRDIKDDVDHKHSFSNKQDWYQTLERIANEDRAWLGQLYEPIKRIAWKIRDKSFDHDKRDAVRC